MSPKMTACIKSVEEMMELGAAAARIAKAGAVIALVGDLGA
ncbi:MAG: hypothetical protein RLY69_1088, partial [Verrucomicrobiota bacterium]